MGQPSGEKRILIQSEDHVVVAGEVGRTLATQLGFATHERTGIVIAIMEVARNILRYAHHGEVILRRVRRATDDREGIAVIARDAGPGIMDIALALQDGYSTGNSLGLGLPGARRLMDDFEIISKRGEGTIVTMKKWKV